MCSSIAILAQLSGCLTGTYGMGVPLLYLGPLVSGCHALLANKAEANSAYWGNVALTAGWSPNSVFQKEQRDYERSRGGRKRAKLGGSGPWVATRPAMVYLLKRWKLYY